MTHLFQEHAHRKAALRFMTHLVGDLHQPLHIVGRAHGGNFIRVRFGDKHANLHKVWDTHMLERRIEQLSNYSVPLDRPAWATALRGTKYDAYVRWILVEGLGQGTDAPVHPRWPDWREWTTCPSQPMHIAGVSDPTPSAKGPMCPLAWASEMHAMGCRYAFAYPVPGSTLNMLSWVLAILPGVVKSPDVAIPVYLDPVYENMVLEKALAMAGVRLAYILNTLFYREARAQYSMWMITA